MKYERLQLSTHNQTTSLRRLAGDNLEILMHRISQQTTSDHVDIVFFRIITGLPEKVQLYMGFWQTRFLFFLWKAFGSLLKAFLFSGVCSSECRS